MPEIPSIPRARILEDASRLEELPLEVQFTVAKVMVDKCDVAGCGGQLYACVQNHFFCESCAEPFLDAPPHLLEENAFILER